MVLLDTFCSFLPLFGHLLSAISQQKRELRLSFLLVRAIVLQNLLNAAGVGSRQRLSHCHANGGPCPSRQTCRFACETFEQGETYSTCPVNYTPKEAFSVLPFLRFLGFFHHFGRKIVLFKKLSPTILTRFFKYAIVALRDKNQGDL